jgi:AhpD family alkylhydroperoxidase
MILPNAVQAIQALQAAMQKGGVPSMTLGIVHLHLGVSQINGCSPCVDPGTRYAKKAGEFDGVIFAAAARRDATYFTAAESAALALTEAVTRLSDRADPVPGEVWDEAARHYDEPALAALILSITTTNVFNRLNVWPMQVAGAWTP